MSSTDSPTAASPTAASPTDVVAETHDAHDGHAHSDLHYVKVFMVLFVITAVEVAWLYLGLPSWALVGGLFAMMAVKFFLICGEFMHLKVDIKLFTQLFLMGLTFAVVVYTVMLSGVNFWQSF